MRTYSPSGAHDGHDSTTGDAAEFILQANRRFLGNVLTWLLVDGTVESQEVRFEPPPEVSSWIGPLTEQYRDLCQIEDTGERTGTVAFVERLLEETGVLKALARPSWMP